MTRDEELELRGLVGIAWEGRHEPDFRERAAAVVEWHHRRHIRAYERRLRSRAAVLQALRETNPQPRGGHRAA